MKALFVTIVFFLALISVNGQLSIEDEAPGFKLKNIDNTLVDLEQFNKEKGVVLIFTCNHCPYAVLYEDRIVELDAKYKSKGFPVVAVNPNNPKTFKEDSFDNMIIRAKEKGFTFPYLVDDKGIYSAYGATKTPHVYLLQNYNGKFIVKYIGAIDDNPRDSKNVTDKYLEKAIDALLKGNNPRITETKAIGCSIKPY